MYPDLSNSIWTLPGSRKFIQSIQSDLMNGVSLVIFSPLSLGNATFNRILVDSLEKDFYQNVNTIDLALQAEKSSPFEVLCNYYPDLTKNQYLEKAVDSQTLPDIILIDNLDSCSPSRRQDWINTLARWAEACSSTGVKHSLLLLLKMDDSSKLNLPSSNVRLKYRIMAGFPSSLEIRMLCRLEANQVDAECQWREYILASLAGNDISLCELLWDDIYQPFEKILSSLKCHAKQIGWDQNTIDSCFNNWRPKPPGFELSLLPIESTFSLLSSGKTLFTPEYGEEIHPSLLAINNRESEIVHRIWRAQAALLLPAIDDFRRRICSYFSIKYGENWAVIENKNLSSPLEMGELKIFFDSLPNNSWEKGQWGSGVLKVWRIRNDLAHYKPISYQSFIDFWRISSSVHNILFVN